MIVDLSLLPSPDVIEPLDYETLLAERKAALVAQYPTDQQSAITATLALESEPLTKLLEESAYRELILRQRINEAALALMLAYSENNDLDQLAANVNLTRHIITPADNTTQPPTPAVKETDSDLRERIQFAYEGLSVAGPRNAYIKHARDAHALVADVSAESPEPAVVIVSVLSRKGNGEASAELINTVFNALNDEDIRPLADRLTVQSAQIIDYAIQVELFVYPGPELEPILQAAEVSLQTYISAQRRIGRDIRRSAIFAALHVPGVQRVELTEPAADIIIHPNQASHCTGYIIDYGGTDE